MSMINIILVLLLLIVMAGLGIYFYTKQEEPEEEVSEEVTEEVPTAPVPLLVKYVKIIHNVPGKHWLHFREVQVFNEDGVNVALNKTTTQSSTNVYNDTDFTGAVAVNGDTSVSYLENMFHTLNTESPWWMVNLDTPVKVRSIKLYNRADGTWNTRLNGATVQLFDKDMVVVKEFTANSDKVQEFTMDSEKDTTEPFDNYDFNGHCNGVALYP
jgi:hypothetical protein